MNSSEPIFWDIVGPLSLVVFVGMLVLTVIGVKRNSFIFAFISSLVSGFVAVIFAWSIGKYIAVVAFIQLIISIYIWRKKS